MSEIEVGGAAGLVFEFEYTGTSERVFVEGSDCGIVVFPGEHWTVWAVDVGGEVVMFGLFAETSEQNEELRAQAQSVIDTVSWMDLEG